MQARANALPFDDVEEAEWPTDESPCSANSLREDSGGTRHFDFVSAGMVLLIGRVLQKENCCMPYEFPPQVDELLQRQLETGEYASEDEVLVAALEALQSQTDDWQAVREALDTLDAGNPGVSLDDAVAEIRRRNNAP